jgi:DNA-binding transcriptional LysR family regulator
VLRRDRACLLILGIYALYGAIILLVTNELNSHRVEISLPLCGMIDYMDRFDELIVFIAILDAGSLAAAARRLRRSPPAVTRSLAALEQRVGTRLIERTTRRLSPTEAGQRLAAQARRLLSDYGDAVGKTDRQRDAPLSGLLRITAPTLFGRWHLASLVESFLDAHPRVQIELVLTNGDLDLIQERLDIAVRIGALADSGLVARQVGHVRGVVFGTPEYLTRRGRPRTPRDLLKHDIVFISRRPSPIEWRFRVSGQNRAVRLAPRLMVTDVEVMLNAVKAGRGIGRTLSYQVADDFSSGALERLLPEFELPSRPVQLVIPSARHMLPTVRAFLDHASKELDVLRVIHE